MRLLISVLVASFIGCAQVSQSGRDIVRIGPYQESIPDVGIAPGNPKIDAGTNVLTEQELRRVQTAARKSFQEVMSARGKQSASSASVVRITRCQIEAGASRSATEYLATCRLDVVRGGEVFASVEGRGRVQERSRAVTQDVADANRATVRDDVLSVSRVEEVIDGAIIAAVTQLYEPGTMAGEGRGQDRLVRDTRRIEGERKLRDEAVRKLAGPALADEGELLDALSSIAAYGRPKDAAVCADYVDHTSGHIRYAVSLCMAEHVLKAYHAPLRRLQNDEDQRVRETAQIAIRRYIALYGDAAFEEVDGRDGSR